MSYAQTTLAHMALATCSLLFWTSASAAQPTLELTRERSQRSPRGLQHF